MTPHASAATLSALEWEKVVSALSRHAASNLGRTLCESIEPTVDLDAIRERLEENRDARKVLVEDGPLPLQGVHDPSEACVAASKGGILSTDEFVRIGVTARIAERVRRFFDDRKGRYPRLSHHAKAIPSLKSVADEIEKKVEPDGTVPDRASTALGPLRRQLSQLRSRLQRTAEEILVDPKYSRHIQEGYSTIRSGRVVIPFRTAAKGLFGGIVHDTSQSGQTVYFEPEALVHLNNEVKMAELEVEREIARILQDLSAFVARNAEPLVEAVRLLALLDFAQARGMLAEETGAGEPTVVANGETLLKQARHPLLVLSVAHQPGSGKEVVPNEIALGKGATVLVLTGPNAGGKSVALKTLGLCTLMAMAGLSVPASSDSTVSVFGRIFAAVGDEQSVERDLSTFSGHIRRLDEILSECGRGSLVLLDEVVSGTDPREGAAIARAFLETLADREVRALATTHFEELKAIAFDDDRFRNGSMEFDQATLRPTYRLRAGVPGRSMAMEIARSLGFPEEVLTRAARYLSDEGRRLDEVIAGLDAERARLAATEKTVAARLSEIEQTRRTIDEQSRKVREEESRLLAKSRERIAAETRKAEVELRSATALLKKEKRVETVTKAQDVVRAWKEQAGKAEEDPLFRAAMSGSQPVPAEAILNPGRKVFVVSLKKEAEVVSVSGAGSREVEVAAGGMRLRVPRTDVRVAQGTVPVASSSEGRRSSYGSTDPGIYIQSPDNTLDLRGAYVDDALPDVDVFLDRLSLSAASHGFIIHGHGTGALKVAVRRHLKGNQYLSKFFPAPQSQGGDGVTIVLLK